MFKMVTGPTTQFCDFVWAWFDPTDEMRETYRKHRIELQNAVDPSKTPKKVSNVSAVGDLVELAEARRWLFFDGVNS
jgi:hypothetical protein